MSFKRRGFPVLSLLPQYMKSSHHKKNMSNISIITGAIIERLQRGLYRFTKLPARQFLTSQIYTWMIYSTHFRLYYIANITVSQFNEDLSKYCWFKVTLNWFIIQENSYLIVNFCLKKLNLKNIESGVTTICSERKMIVH